MPRLRIPSTVDRREVRRFVLELDRRLRRLDRAVLLADWNLQSGRSAVGSESAQLRRARLLADPALLDWTRRARERGAPPLLARQLELIERVVLDALVEQQPRVVRLRGEMQRRIVAFRPRWRGRRVGRGRLTTVLWYGESASERREAYYALEPLHRPLEPSLRELVRLRNARARDFGYRSFADLRLRFCGLTEGRLNELMAEVIPVLRARVASVRRRFEGGRRSSGWHPWDTAFAQHAATPLPARAFPREGMFERVVSAVSEWGFRVDRMSFRVAYHDLPAGGLTLAPDPPRDVRILVHPGGGWLAHMILFHEMGHAVHSASIRAPRHLLRWRENVPGFGPFDEGIGSLFESIPTTAAWLASRPGVGLARARQFEAGAADDTAVAVAGHLAWFPTELSLYRDPEGDPSAATYRLARRVFGYDEYRPLSFVDPFFVDSPIYGTSYFLATLFEHQVRRAMLRRLGEPFWPNRRVAPWLTRVWFAPGSTFEWTRRLREATGEPFGTRAFRAAVRPDAG